MIKITATSPSFTGEIYFVYADDGKLLSLDFLSAELTMQQTQWLKVTVPVFYDEQLFVKEFGGAKLEFLNSNYEVTFDMFWAKYAKKINRPRCEVLWKGMKPMERAKAYFGLTSYDSFLGSLEWKRTKADPENYLKKQMWNNEWK